MQGRGIASLVGVWGQSPQHKRKEGDVCEGGCAESDGSESFR